VGTRAGGFAATESRGETTPRSPTSAALTRIPTTKTINTATLAVSQRHRRRVASVPGMSRPSSCRNGSSSSGAPDGISSAKACRGPAVHGNAVSMTRSRPSVPGSLRKRRSRRHHTQNPSRFSHLPQREHVRIGAEEPSTPSSTGSQPTSTFYEHRLRPSLEQQLCMALTWTRHIAFIRGPAFGKLSV